MQDLDDKVEDLRRKVDEVRESQLRMEADLKEHMRRTDILEQLHKDNESRIDLLEKPMEAREYMKSVLIDITKFLGFLLAVGSVLKLFGVL